MSLKLKTICVIFAERFIIFSLVQNTKNAGLVQLVEHRTRNAVTYRCLYFRRNPTLRTLLDIEMALGLKNPNAIFYLYKQY